MSSYDSVLEAVEYPAEGCFHDVSIFGGVYQVVRSEDKPHIRNKFGRFPFRDIRDCVYQVIALDFCEPHAGKEKGVLLD